VSDNGFDFRPPPSRREPKRFEPPPWEADAFEELQRKKTEEKADEDLTSAIGELAGEQEPGLEAQVPQVGPAADAIPEAAAEPDEPAAKAGSGGVDDKTVLELLARLAEEEPPASQDYWKVAIGSALLMGALGLVLVIWGMAALVGSRTTGAVGSFGGTVLLLFGGLSIAAALWLVVRTLRQRGVL